MKSVKMNQSKIEQRIYLDQEWKIEYWMAYFKVSQEVLYDAVEQLGTNMVVLENFFNVNSSEAA